MSLPTRRDLLGRAVLGAAACSLAPAAAAASRGPGSAEGRRRGVERLALDLAKEPRARAMELILAAVGQGASWLEAETAVYLAANRTVHSNPPGMLSHVILEAESILQLTTGAPEAELATAVLFHADDTKAAQARVRTGWTLGEAPGEHFRTREAARASLVESLRAFDGDGADRAMADLVRLGAAQLGLDVALERVVGDLGGLGHKAIHAVHTARTLPRLGSSVGMDALRSLAIGVASYSADAELADGPPSRELGRGFPVDWAAGEARPDESLALARVLLEASPERARFAAIAVLADGGNAATVWDGIRLAAADLFARRPSLLPVHAVTIENAMAFVGRTAEGEERQRAALLVAASWIPRLRDRLVAEGRTPRDGSVLDVLVAPPGEPISLDVALDDPTFAHVRDHLAANELAPFAARLRALLFRGVEQNHQVKFAAAALEDARLCHPRWRPALLASVFGYLPRASSERAASHVRSQELLARRAR